MNRRAIGGLLGLLLLGSVTLGHAGSYDDFFSAIRRDDAPLIASLLQRGFDPNTRNPAGLPGLYLALREPSLKAAMVLIDWPATDLNASTDKGETPLMIAALDNRLAIARRLIERGADVNQTGWTPLHYAATKGHLEMIALMLEQHAYIDAESPNGSTPLMMAASYGTPSAVKLLLEEGADPLLKNQQGLSAIDFASRAARPEVAELIAAFARGKTRGKW